MSDKYWDTGILKQLGIFWNIICTAWFKSYLEKLKVQAQIKPGIENLICPKNLYGPELEVAGGHFVMKCYEKSSWLWKRQTCITNLKAWQTCVMNMKAWHTYVTFLPLGRLRVCYTLWCWPCIYCRPPSGVKCEPSFWSGSWSQLTCVGHHRSVLRREWLCCSC